MVLSTGDVKTSTPSDCIAPLQQVPWAEPQPLCCSLSTSTTPKFVSLVTGMDTNGNAEHDI